MASAVLTPEVYDRRRFCRHRPRHSRDPSERSWAPGHGPTTTEVLCSTPSASPTVPQGPAVPRQLSLGRTEHSGRRGWASRSTQDLHRLLSNGAPTYWNVIRGPSYVDSARRPRITLVTKNVGMGRDRILQPGRPMAASRSSGQRSPMRRITPYPHLSKRDHSPVFLQQSTNQREPSVTREARCSDCRGLARREPIDWFRGVG